MKTDNAMKMTTQKAHAIVDRDLKRTVDHTVRRAHAAGARGRTARAEHTFSGPLGDAVRHLGRRIEEPARSYLHSQMAWAMYFRYERGVVPVTMIISLR